MNHLKWMGHASTIVELQRCLHQDLESCEVTLVAKDGISVRGHTLVLSTSSDLMRNLLADVPRGHEATILIPDIRGELLEGILSFIYIGEAHLPSTCLSDFLEAINLLGVKSAISFECTTTALNTSSSLCNESATKSISGLQIENTEFLDEEEDDADTVVGKMEVNTSIVAEVQESQAPRPLEFIDMYSEQAKITYSIDSAAGSNQFILTDNSGAYTINKLDSPGRNINAEVSDNLVDEDGDGTDDVDDSHLIEEFVVASPLKNMSSKHGEDLCDDEPDDEMITIKKESDGKRGRRGTAWLKGAKKTNFGQQKYDTLKSDIKDAISDAIELAADAVVNEGLSLQKAADRFDISKTVLWRRVRTNPEYMKNLRKKPCMSEAHQRLKNGDSLKSISQDLHIPMSTLHRHKVRLASEGNLPDHISCRRRDGTPKDELRDKLAKAVHACLHEGMSQNHAANLFEIPKSTLWRHLQRKVAAGQSEIKNEADEDDDEDDDPN